MKLLGGSWSKGDLFAAVAAMLAIPGMPKFFHWDRTSETTTSPVPSSHREPAVQKPTLDSAPEKPDPTPPRLRSDPSKKEPVQKGEESKAAAVEHRPAPFQQLPNQNEAFANPAPTSGMPSGDHNFVNNAPNYGTQKLEDNRQYGVPNSLPNVIGLFTKPEPAIPRPQITAEMSIQERQQRQNDHSMQKGSERGPVENPGLTLRFGVDRPFSTPLFLVRCNHPCLPSSILFREGSTEGFTSMSTPSFFLTNDPTIVVFGAGTRQIVGTDVWITIVVRSRDEVPVSSATVEPYAQEVNR